ncbi:MAG: transposase [Gammaproteobacteria bacterium]|nr:MAG: transposase [Gammaproteobacteria bacterium]
MTRPRSQLVSISDTPYYHVISRCVRRSYLCGIDPLTGANYEHRRQWIENRIRILSSIFGLQICSYSVMSNHIHLVIKLCPEEIESLSNAEVLERWTSLYKGPPLVQRWQAGEVLGWAEKQAVSDCINRYRMRLGSLSWFMKCLNEPIARIANKEDKCTGHFWESRFKSQALLSEEAILSCMAYVDLNPVRANMAATPEESEYTSIRERIQPSFDLVAAVDEQIEEKNLIRFGMGLKPLAKFEGNESQAEQRGVLFSLEGYLELVDYTGRIIRPDKRGAISMTLPPILQRIDIDFSTWLKNSTQFEAVYREKFAKRRSRRYLARAG